MEALYVPIANPLGFTSTLSDAGNNPTLGVSVTHCVPPGKIVVVKAAVLFPPLTATVCAGGSVPPTVQLYDNDTGFATSVGV
jgi:hypothetical protein